MTRAASMAAETVRGLDLHEGGVASARKRSYEAAAMTLAAVGYVGDEEDEVVEPVEDNQ